MPPIVQTWLARLSFSFLIVGLLLVYQGYRTGVDPDATVPSWVYYAGAVVCFILAGIGIKQRHRGEGE